jgi:hypothetical protein
MSELVNLLRATFENSCGSAPSLPRKSVAMRPQDGQANCQPSNDGRAEYTIHPYTKPDQTGRNWQISGTALPPVNVGTMSPSPQIFAWCANF